MPIAAQQTYLMLLTSPSQNTSYEYAASVIAPSAATHWWHR